jgi:glycosyltransferase involved in cell wall biosynthesis
MPENHDMKPEVVFFQRKPRPVGNYSVEIIFEDVRRRLGDRIRAVVAVSPYESSGFLKRLASCLYARRSQGQVNHVTGDVSFLGILLEKRRTINTILDCGFLTDSKGIKYAVLKFFWLHLPERRARYLTAISEATKREILRHNPCDPGKIVVIPVAISPAFRFKEKAFDTAKPRILQLGTAPNKNIPVLVRALKGLSCILHIIGKKVPEYEELLRSNGMQYEYESNLSEQEIVDRYERSDIVTLVSTYEGFGMPILEGQAVGRPVITSRVFSMPEVAGDAAILVDPADVEGIRAGFERIIGDRTFREELVRKGLENVRRFDPDVIADQYLKLYTEIASGR